MPEASRSGRSRPRAVLLALVLAAASQPTGVSAQPAPSTEDLGCGPRAAALFTGERGFKVWITRSGTMAQGNPLRPLDAVTVKVLEAHIGSKVATAYGPDFASLRRGLSPADLQAANGGTAIHWGPDVNDLPRQLRIVAEDGATLADLAFDSCGEAPKIASAKPAKPAAKRASGASEVPAPASGTPDATPAAAKPAAPKRAARKPAERTPPGLNLPQGAIGE